MEENLGTRVSADTISSITDRILPKVKAWRNRTTLYCASNTQFYYVSSKNQKEFFKDLKTVYKAVNQEAGEENLMRLEEKWGE